MRINEYGRVVRNEWMKIPEIRREMELGEFVIMPNHMHGIVMIMNAEPVGAYGHTPVCHSPQQNTPMQSPSKTLGAMVRGFKSAVTKHINTIRKTPGTPVWQRNYYEHVIRDDADYNRIAEYVTGNPKRWIEDRLHPDNKPKRSDIAGETDMGEIDVDATGVGAYGHTPVRNTPVRCAQGYRNE